MTAALGLTAPSTSAEARAQLAALEREPGTLSEKIRAARLAVARDEPGSGARLEQLKLQRDELADHLPDLRDKLVQQIAELEAAENGARIAEGAQRLVLRLTQATGQCEVAFPPTRDGAVGTVGRLGEFRRMVEARGHALAEQSGTATALRTTVANDAALAWLAALLHAAAEYLVRPADAPPVDREILNRITSLEADAQRAAYDAFYGRQPS